MTHAQEPLQPARPRAFAPPRAAAIAVAALLLAGCTAGPQAVAPGEYRLYATSSEAKPAEQADLAITNNAVTLTVGQTVTETTLGAPAGEFTLCPPSGKGTPLVLGPPMTIGDLHLTRPAIYGDCGQTKPVRLTLIDLDSHNNNTPLPFTRWAEFCSHTDPDC